MIAPASAEIASASGRPIHGLMPKWKIERRRRVGAEPDIERVAERELARQSPS